MPMMYTDISRALNILLSMEPAVFSVIEGSRFFPSIRGTVSFYPASTGTLVAAHVVGLPDKTGPCGKSFYGFHIHSGSSCTGNETDPFADTGEHYNPYNCPHPHHIGDLPPLLSNNGEALSIFYTDLFLPEEVIGHTLVVHDMPDDFRSQPSGNSGIKIACGEIVLTSEHNSNHLNHSAT